MEKYFIDNKKVYRVSVHESVDADFYNPREYFDSPARIWSCDTKILSGDYDALSPLELAEKINLEEKSGILRNDFAEMSIKKEMELVEQYGNYIYLPVFYMSHGGTAFSSEPFGDPWDSGFAGLIYTSENDAADWYNTRDHEKIREYMRGWLKTYDLWQQGYVYGACVDLVSNLGNVLAKGFEPEFHEDVEEPVESIITDKLGDDLAREVLIDYIGFPAETKLYESLDELLKKEGASLPQKVYKVEYSVSEVREHYVLADSEEEAEKAFNDEGVSDNDPYAYCNSEMENITVA